MAIIKTTHVGDVPVIVARDEHGQVWVLENRCAHRGAEVCLEKFGNAKWLTCVYTPGVMIFVTSWWGSRFATR